MYPMEAKCSKKDSFDTSKEDALKAVPPIDTRAKILQDLLKKEP